MKYITLGEYHSRKLVNIAYYGNSRVVKIIRDNHDNTLLVRLYDGNGMVDRVIKTDDMLEVR